MQLLNDVEVNFQKSDFYFLLEEALCYKKNFEKICYKLEIYYFYVYVYVRVQLIKKRSYISDNM